VVITVFVAITVFVVNLVMVVIAFLALVCFVLFVMIIVFAFGRFAHPFPPLSSGVIKILMTSPCRHV
jgi:uncharacterized membrane protein YoaK (UPF0700 family)